MLLSGLAISVAILILCYRYFSEQNKIMEDAVSQITGYLSGDKDARIECDDEGQLYRLFHEVNTLVSILNAHAENETNSKAFLKNTISDISHQLKTPLAALNIYNGILQEEAAEFPTIKEFLTLSEQELDRIEALVQSLLKITKLDAGTICLEKSFTSVSQLLESVRNQFLFRAQQENKTITLSEGDDVPFLCDRSWMTEAVGNIVKNALDHMQAGDFVSIASVSYTHLDVYKRQGLTDIRYFKFAGVQLVASSHRRNNGYACALASDDNIDFCRNRIDSVHYIVVCSKMKLVRYCFIFRQVKTVKRLCSARWIDRCDSFLHQLRFCLSYGLPSRDVYKRQR